ncbi:MAG: hypothetical protein KC475_02460, partial [Cyanobacteria bacterium HKST-UBA03]|nr:hypothetical protein [Cyanobacteria bacterium HKST-UBA03]
MNSPLRSICLLLMGLVLFFVCSSASRSTAPKTYQQALPGYRYHFPMDHWAHKGFKTEWWYYTG